MNEVIFVCIALRFCVASRHFSSARVRAFVASASAFFASSARAPLLGQLLLQCLYLVFCVRPSGQVCEQVVEDLAD